MHLYKVADLVQNPPMAPSREKSAIPPTKLYEVGRTSSSSGSSGSSGYSGDPTPPQRSKLTIGSLVAILDDAIRFGDEVSIQCAEGMLIVNALPDSHKKIEEFVSTLRKELAARRTLAVRAVWLVLDDEKAAKTFGSAAPASQTLTAESLKAMEGDILYQVSGLCLEGEHASLGGGRCETVLTDTNALVSENVSAMSPTIQIVQSPARSNSLTILPA